MDNMTKLVDGIVEINGVKFVNTTPHDIIVSNTDSTFKEIIPKSGFVAKYKDVVAKVSAKKQLKEKGVLYNKHTIIGDIEIQTILENFVSSHDDVVLIGTSKAANAYRGLIIGLERHHSYKHERVYNIDDLIIY